MTTPASPAAPDPARSPASDAAARDAAAGPGQDADAAPAATVPAAAPLRNWAGNVRFRAARVHRPSSVDELRAVVARAESVRALGTGHSFNRIADTPADLVLTDALPAEVVIDAEARTASVPGGMRLAELSARLHRAGFALANLPSLPHISLAGAVATGTHGSGDGNQGVAGLVRALELIGPDGRPETLGREDPGTAADFAGAVVGLGALGVVTRLTVDLQPAFRVAQHVHLDADLDRVVARREEVFASGYSVSVFTDWASGRCAVWRKLRAATDDELGRSSRTLDLTGLVGGRPATGPEHPVPGMPAGNCTAQLGEPGPWHERLPHFRPEFTPSSGEELQSEFFVARERAGEALEAVRRLGAKVAPVLQVSEIRTIAADDLWLSPSQGRDSVALHFTWVADRAAVTPVLAAIEQALLPLGARPHWGKLFTGGPAAALAGYGNAARFGALLARRDPGGKFRNTFVAGLFPAG